MSDLTYWFDGGGGEKNHQGEPPGPSGWGWVRSDGVTACGGLAPGTTSNVAEYTALTMAIIDAHAVMDDLGDTKFIFKGDSKLVVEQVLGNWQVRADKLRPYVHRVQMLLGGIPEWRLQWVPRNLNRLADEQAWKGKGLWTPDTQQIGYSLGSKKLEGTILQRGWPSEQA